MPEQLRPESKDLVDAAAAPLSQRRVTSLGAFSVISVDFVLTFEFFVRIETDDAVEVSEFDHIL